MRRLWGEMRQPARLRMVRLVIGELASFPDLAAFYFEEVVLRTRRLVGAVLDRGIARGEVHPAVRHAATHGLPAMMLQVLLSRFLFAPNDPDPLEEEALLEGLLDLARHGIMTGGR